MRYLKASCRFTLIELLIAIAIIAILASMLLPALRNARGSAKKIQCVSNLKQQSIGMTMYTQDWSVFFPAPLYEIDSSTNPWTYNDWQYAIVDYLYPGKDMSSARHYRPGTVFWCPEEVNPTFNATRDPHNESNNSYRYSMNKQLPDIGDQNPKKITRIKAHSTTCLVTESFFSSGACNAWVFANETGNVPHNRRANVLYVDLHVSDLVEKEFPLSNGNSFWSGL